MASEEIGRHKGAVETLLHEKKELSRLLQIVNSQLQRRLKALEEAGVDTDEFMEQLQQKQAEQQKQMDQKQKQQQEKSRSQSSRTREEDSEEETNLSEDMLEGEADFEEEGSSDGSNKKRDERSGAGKDFNPHK